MTRTSGATPLRRHPSRRWRRRRTIPRLVALALVALLAAALAACGGDGGPAGAGPAPAGADGAVEHVHALGVDPGDGAILLATHTGLFRLAEGEDAPTRVGDLRQDTMGFTVLGADTYLGSGHPDPRTDLPPLLGLIRSTDGGRSWTSVSLLGEADFHVLRASGDRVAGIDSHTGALLVSGDSGRTWRRRTSPGPGVVDLVVHPRRPAVLVASTRAGLARSDDGGRTWRTTVGPPALLGWPSADALLRIDAGGRVAVSRDAGRTWSSRGEIGDTPAAFSATRDRLVAATHEGRLLHSTDGGVTWEIRAELP
jgi:hypothetical protein